MENIENFKNLIKNAKKIAIFGHKNTDGDCVGSVCAFAKLLEELDKDYQIYIDSTIPKYLDYIPLVSKISNSDVLKDFDLYIALDSSSLDRLGKYGEVFDSFSSTILIDHHKTNTHYAKLNLVESDAPACGEVLFHVLTEAEFNISKEVATYLLSAIVSDTNCFTNNNVRNQTFVATSKLLELGADYSTIIYKNEREKTKTQVKVASFMLKKVKVLDDITYITYTYKDAKKLGCEFEDFNKFYTLINDIEGAKITVIFKEREKNEIGISFRSQPKYDVSEIAKSLGGGGHKNAAATHIRGNLNKVIKSVLKTVRSEIDRIDAK